MEDSKGRIIEKINNGVTLNKGGCEYIVDLTTLH